MRKPNEKSAKVISVFFFLLLIFILSFFMKGTETITYTFHDKEGFLVTSASGFSKELKWSQISEVEVLEHYDEDELINGTNDGKEKSGIWVSEEYGIVVMCIDAKVENCIKISCEEEIVLVNFESKEATENLANAIKENCEM